MKSSLNRIHLNKIITNAEEIAKTGKLSDSEILNMSQLGLDNSMLKRIASEYKDKGVDIVEWDIEVRDAILQAIPRGTDKGINTPNAGELPAFMDHWVSKLVFQFQTFGMTAWNQTLIAGLQKSDANFYLSVAFQVGLAYLAVQIKSKLSGTPIPDKWEGADGLAMLLADRSGLFALPFSAYNQVGGAFGLPATSRLSALNDRYYHSGEPDWARALGPVPSLLADASTALEPVWTDAAVAAGLKKKDVDWSQKHIDAARRITPYQNLWFTNEIFNQVSSSIASKAGIKYKRKPTIIYEQFKD